MRAMPGKVDTGFPSGIAKKNSALSVQEVAIAFGGVAAVAGVSFSVSSGDIFAIIGPNGAGKPTLFNIVPGIYPPARGRVALGNEEVTGLAPHHLAARGR